MVLIMVMVQRVQQQRDINSQKSFVVPDGTGR